MQEPPFDPPPEPFGQRGVLPFLWPTLVLLCAIGFCTCVLMLQRSAVVWDTVSNTTSSRQVIISSVIGRLVVTILPYGNGSETGQSVWDFDSRVFDSIQDGWAESWQKTLGVEWGDESLRQNNRPPADYWRLRIRWRTLAVLYAIPVLIEIARRAWRRFIPPSTYADLAHVSTSHR